MMTVDDQLRLTLHREAEAVEPSPDGWASIARRIERRQRRTRTATLSLVAGFSFAAIAVAVAVVMVTMAVPETPDQNVAAEGGAGPGFRSTTTVAVAPGTPTTVSAIGAVPGQIAAGSPGTDNLPPVGSDAATASAAGAATGETGMLSSGFHVGSVYPETAAELEATQAQVDQGHQPWWVDRGMVASSYLANRGLKVDEGGEPRAYSDPWAMRYAAGGVGGWVFMSQLADGSIYFVESSRSDRIVQLRVDRQGDRLAVEVRATAAGRVVVRSKRPGADWNPSTTQTVGAGNLISLTLEGSASSALIVQVRHEGDDGKVGLAEEPLGLNVPGLAYEGLHDGSILRPGGLGPVALGATLAEVARWAGIATTTERGESCAHVSPAGRPEGVAFIATQGDDVVRVITVDAPGVGTEAGIRVGSTVAEVRAAYPGVEERIVDGDGRIVYRPDDPILGGFEMVFGISGGEVAVMWSGREGLSLTDEICA